MTKVNALECLDCGDIIYSRTRHDMRWCSCGKVAVDGGIDYFKWSTTSDAKYFIHGMVEIDANAKELYDDWSQMSNKFGKLVEFEVETL